MTMTEFEKIANAHVKTIEALGKLASTLLNTLVNEALDGNETESLRDQLVTTINQIQDHKQAMLDMA